MDSNNLNPDIVGDINPDGSHTAQFAFSSKAVGGRRRKYKSIRNKKSKLKKYRSRRHRKSRKHRRSRRQRGGLNPTYRSYTTSFEPGLNGMYANGPSVGKIIEQFN
jgi:hypothetical protein